MKLSGILRQVKTLVWIEDEYKQEAFLCICIQRVCSGKERGHLLSWIDSMLPDCYMLEDWIKMHYSELWESWERNGTEVKNANRCRQAWLDWMIAELEKTGE